VENYSIALNIRPDTIERLDLRKLIGLRAKVTIETARPKFTKGLRKGQPKPEIFHYSKVGDIVKPLGWDDKITVSRSKSDD
jgi:hypothetical protein